MLYIYNVKKYYKRTCFNIHIIIRYIYTHTILILKTQLINFLEFLIYNYTYINKMKIIQF